MRLRILVLAVVVAAGAVAASGAPAATYPAAYKTGFRSSCVATAVVSLKARHVAGAQTKATRYCNCVLVRLEARLPLSSFLRYNANIFAGRAQNPAHVRLMTDSVRACAQTVLA